MLLSLAMGDFKFIDLFCGIGGFHAAMSQLGGECVFAADIDENCRKTYQQNFGLEPNSDISKVNAADVPSHDVLCAGFPCQAFSKAGKREGMNDPRGTLFFDIKRIAQHHKPKYMLLENVRNLVGHDNGNTWRVIKSNLEELGYVFSHEPIIFSPHNLGIPQFRERVFILCKRKDVKEGEVEFSEQRPRPACDIARVVDKTVNDKRYNISKIERKILDIWNDFAQNVKKPLPTFPVWTAEFEKENLNADISAYPKWKQRIIEQNRALWEDNKAFLKPWLVKAKKNKNFKGAKAKFEWQVGDANPEVWSHLIQFRPSGIRIKKATYFPALVAITQTSIVGELGRRITPKEAAALQSFPESYQLHPVDRIAYKQLGNAVNVDVVKFFAKRLLGKQEKGK